MMGEREFSQQPCTTQGPQWRQTSGLCMHWTLGEKQQRNMPRDASQPLISAAKERKLLIVPSPMHPNPFCFPSCWG